MLILAYHSIHAERDDALSVSPASFVAQIRWLRRTHTIVSLSELVEVFRQGKTNNNMAAITFDDGLRDNYEVLFPMIRSLRIPVTIFLALDFIGSNRLFEGENLIKNTRLDPRHRMGMTWEQVMLMADAGIEFGSHTFSHRRLSQLPDAELHHEIADSRSFLQQRLHTPVRFFCYPFGDFDERCVAAVRRAGYSGAVVTPTREVPNSVFSLHRVGVYRHNSLAMLRLKASAFGQRLRGLSLMRTGLGGANG